MTKNDIINDIVSSLVFTLDKDKLELVKSTFIVKMQGYEIHEICTLPSTEVHDNEFIFKRFMIDMLAKGLKQSSIVNYMNIIKPFFDMVGKNYMEVSAQDIIDYIAIKKVKPGANGKMCSQTYIANINKVLFIFFEWAYRKHHIDVDIMRDVDRIRPKQKRKERLSLEEIEECRENVKNDREKALLELMLSTGVRVGEIANMKIEDVDFHKRKIHIPDGKTDYSERDVYLTVKARNALRKYIGNRLNGFVFRPDRNIIDDAIPITTGSINKWAKDIGERAGCHCTTTVHVYRKTFASMEYQRTKDIKYVSILLGHSSTEVTERYYLVDDLKQIEYQALYAA